MTTADAMREILAGLRVLQDRVELLRDRQPEPAVYTSLSFMCSDLVNACYDGERVIAVAEHQAEPEPLRLAPHEAEGLAMSLDGSPIPRRPA